MCGVSVGSAIFVGNTHIDCHPELAGGERGILRKIPLPSAFSGRVRDDIQEKWRQIPDAPHHSFDKPLAAISDILIRFISTSTFLCGAGALVRERGAMWRSAGRSIIGDGWERPCAKRLKLLWKANWAILGLGWPA